MNCSEVQSSLARYSAQALEAAPAQQVHEHLQGCVDCQREWRALMMTVRALEAVEPGEPPRDLWPGIRARLADRSAPLPQPRGWQAWLAALRTPRRVFATASIAAVAAVTLIIVYLTPRTPAPPDGTLAPHASSFVRGHVLVAKTGPINDPIARAMLAHATEYNDHEPGH